MLNLTRTPRLAVWDLLAVVILPLLCFTVDLHIGGYVAGTFPGTVWTFALTGIGAFLWSRHMPIASRAMPFASGMIATAGVGALLIGLLLFPISLIASIFYGIGLLGFIPFLTAARFLKRSKLLFNVATNHSAPLLVAGFAAGLLPAVFVFCGEQYGDERRSADLLSGDPERVLWVLEGKQFYNFRDAIGATVVDGFSGVSSLQKEACRYRERIPTRDPAVAAALRDLLNGGERTVQDACDLLLDD